MDTDEFYESMIGKELFKVCKDTNLFVRLMTTLNSKDYRRSSIELEYLLDVITFIRNLLRAQTSGLTLELIKDVRLIQILKIVIR